MSETVVSPVSNRLLDMISGAEPQRLADNALLMQQHQQQIGQADIEMVARAASPLLNMSEEQAALAYPGVISYLNSQGYGKHAPPTYPGHAVTQHLVSMGIPAEKQFEYGAGRTAASGAASGLGLGGDGTTGAASAPGAGGGGFTGDKEKDRALIVQRESGGNPTILNYVAQQDPTAYARGATASGKYQFVNSTWAEGMRLAGLDPSQYAEARLAPEAVQDKVFDAVYAKYGTKPWQKGAVDWIKDEQGRYQLAHIRPSAGAMVAPGGTGGPTAPPGVSGVQVGGTPPSPPGGAPGAAAPTGPGGFAAAIPPPAVAAAPPAPGQRVSSNVGAIMQGIDQARTATPASAMPMMAGPGAGGPEAQPLRAPEPGWGTGTPGTYGYSGGSPTPGTVAPAPAPAPVPAAQPPAAPAQPAAPQVPLAPVLPLLPSGLTAMQEKAAREALNAPGVTVARVNEITAHYQALAAQNRTYNEQAAQHNYERTRQAVADVETRAQHAAAAEQRRIENERAAKAAAIADQVEARAQQKSADEQADRGRPYQGSAIEAQDDNILLGGDDGSAKYAGAYSRKAKPIDRPDGSSVTPNMTAYDKPTYRGGKGQVPEGGAPDYGPTKVTPPTTMNVEQGKAASYADRMLQSNEIMNDLDTAAQNWAQRAKTKAGDFVGYNIASPEYQRLRIAQDNFITAKLRDESGATIGTPEFERDRVTFFPQPGDDAATVELKRKFRQTVIEGEQRRAGPAYKPSAAATSTTTTTGGGNPPPPPRGFKVIQ